jgi:hypothetical protein
VAVVLALEHDCWRETFVAHSKWIRLVAWAIVVHLVAERLDWRTARAALVRPVLTLTLSLHLQQIVLERLVLAFYNRLCLRAVRALLTRWVVALVLDQFYCILCHIQAVYALAIRTMSAVPFFYYFVCERLLGMGR